MLNGAPCFLQAFGYSLLLGRAEAAKGTCEALPYLFGIGQGLLFFFEFLKLSCAQAGRVKFAELGFVVVRFGLVPPQFFLRLQELLAAGTQFAPYFPALFEQAVVAGVMVEQRQLKCAVCKQQAAVLGMNVEKGFAERGKFLHLGRAVVYETARAS